MVERPVRRHAIVELAHRPVRIVGDGADREMQVADRTIIFSGDGLRQLFQSVGARRSLELPTVPVFQYPG